MDYVWQRIVDLTFDDWESDLMTYIKAVTVLASLRIEQIEDRGVVGTGYHAVYDYNQALNHWIKAKELSIKKYEIARNERLKEIFPLAAK